jgi:carbamate kinase
MNPGLAVVAVGGNALIRDDAHTALADQYDCVRDTCEHVGIRFGQPDQQWLDRLTVAEAEAYLAAGHYGAGSMRPKIEAQLEFVKGRPGGRGAITNPENIERALRGQTGTWIETT